MYDSRSKNCAGRSRNCAIRTKIYAGQSAFHAGHCGSCCEWQAEATLRYGSRIPRSTISPALLVLFIISSIMGYENNDSVPYEQTDSAAVSA
jgi:hypothetical protein